MDVHDNKAPAKASMVLGDIRMLGQQSNDFREAISWETAVDHRSARVVSDIKDVTSKRVNCFPRGNSGHRRGDYRKKVSAGFTRGSHVGREAQAAGLSSNGKRAVRSRRRTGDTSSPVSQEPEVGG